MSSHPPLTPVPELLRAFLVARGWTLIGGRGSSGVFVAPQQLELGPLEFTVPLERTSDFQLAMTRASGTLADIYHVSPDHMAAVLSAPSLVASISVIGQDTIDGTMPFGRFEGMIDRIKKMLLDTASFVLTDDPVVGQPSQAAYIYLNNCRMLQSQPGSYVTRIQLPEDLRLTLPQLFVEGQVEAHTVNARAMAVLEHVTHDVLDASENVFSEDRLLDSLDVANVTVLRDIAQVFERAGADEMSFRFFGLTEDRRINTGPLTPYRLERLTSYIEFVRERLAGELEVDVTGKIVELRSRDRDRKRNHVGIWTLYRHRPTFVTFSLSATAYHEAIRAHDENLTIRVAGVAKQMRTQVRVTRVAMFEVIERDGEVRPTGA